MEVKLSGSDLERYVRAIWEWLTHIEHWNTLQGWLAGLLIWAATTCLLLWCLKKILELFVTLHDSWERLGLPRALSHSQRTEIRRRQQFAKVLRSDLATLAKAENWNDQFFTDLEAEVEAEGGYFASVFDRIIKKRSYGLRRVGSLTTAIESSAEQTLLVVGEPGSGKSVALRHVAHDLAEAAITSTKSDQLLPLYVNLKELPDAPVGGPTADFFKEFVIENIRRGDADTAAFLREKWDDYRQRGVWFFLFDSFDEIPAVLHAPVGGAVISAHGEAIRQFLSGMSTCRGVVASREYKGPDKLPWEKLRILPLSVRRQDELINNSFLDSEQRTIVRQHLVSTSTVLSHNPLFLTLLCRYVKDRNAPPANDHDLLERHIEHLAHRDPEFIRRHYHLESEQLLIGAATLARMFAERPGLSLAPSQDEIAALFPPIEIPNFSLENLLSALIDVKIGRSDVQGARRGERRFTFAHRRYQETLFVKYLAKVPDYLPPNTLLTDSRWREYCVTLLQSQSTQTLVPLLAEASRIIRNYANRQPIRSILLEFGAHLSYFEWRDDPVVPLLQLLQEGMRDRILDTPVPLSKDIARLLQPRWENGDAYDKLRVIELGGLLPQELLEQYLENAVKTGSTSLRDLAFARISYLREIPTYLSRWTLRRLSRTVMTARTSVELLKAEALGARLPRSLGARFVLRRGRLLRPIGLLAEVFVFTSLVRRILRKTSNDIDAVRETSRRFSDLVFFFTLIYGFAPIPVIIGATSHGPIFLIPGIIVASIYGVIWLRLVISFLLRSEGEPGSLSLTSRVLRSHANSIVHLFRPREFLPVAGALLLLAAPGGILHLIAYQRGFRRDAFLWYPLGWVIIVVLLAAIIGVHYHGLIKRGRSVIGAQQDGALVLQARSFSELAVWIRKHQEMLPTEAHVRSLLSLISSFACPLDRAIASNPLFSADDLQSNRRSITSRLITRLK